jgi:hypothetical protein
MVWIAIGVVAWLTAGISVAVVIGRTITRRDGEPPRWATDESLRPSVPLPFAFATPWEPAMVRLQLVRPVVWDGCGAVEKPDCPATWRRRSGPGLAERGGRDQSSNLRESSR